MLKIAKGRISYPAVIGAVLFMIVQVIATLNLPSLTSNIVNNGVATGDISYIWKIGFEMIGFHCYQSSQRLATSFWRRGHHNN